MIPLKTIGHVDAVDLPSGLCSSFGESLEYGGGGDSERGKELTQSLDSWAMKQSMHSTCEDTCNHVPVSHGYVNQLVN